ncbi:MAG: hypothetical protein JNL74_18690, partial [Fibrobacteres bacterium]|nr:hypothetical protein [Fibrobacterota bacterium]
MLTKKRLMALLFCLTFNIIYSLPAFTSLPTLRQIDSLSYVNFTLSEFTDVEVTIVDTIQKKVIRHLGAGMLGDNAPVPFSKNTLTQSVEWNGRDDNGVTVQDLSGIMARVRAGMRPRYDAMADKLIEKGVKKSNNYWFGASNFETENFFGLSVDSTGTLYVLGTSSVGNTIALRAYDGESGAYRNTIMPFPSGLDRNTLVPYEIMFLDEDNYRYKTSTLADLMYRAGPLNAERFSGYLLPEVVGGDFLAFIYSRMNNVGQFKRTFNTTVHLGLNSVITPSGALIKSPTLASLYSGPLYLTLSKDRKSIFMSGIYSWISTGGNSGWGTGYVDTLSFWRDGQVYKIDIATGVASPFISIPKDSLLASKRAEFQGRGPDASINGVAVDDSGRVFICDRVHNQIGVYDSVGHFIKAILQANADNIAVNKNTGELYVIVRGIGIPTVLKKFSDWRGSNPSVVSNYSFSASVKSYLAVSYKGEKPVVWLSGNQGYGYNNQGIWGVRDDGSQLTLVSSFNDSGYTGGAQYRDAWSGYITRMDADPTTNQVIATNNFHGLFKVEDW